VVAAVVAACAAAAAPAAGAPLVGISDQTLSAFGSQAYADSGSRIARVVVPWDAGVHRVAWVEDWLRIARARRIEPLVTFGRRADDACPGRACVPPSLPDYEHAFERFRERHPWVLRYVPWNEPNHPDEPTVSHPGLVADYFNALRAACAACTVVAGDVLDSDDMASWVMEFSRGLDTAPAVWGLHNYRGVNGFSASSTEAFLRLVRGPVWLTETGGIVELRRTGGAVAMAHDERRAADALRMMFALADEHADRIERIYVFNWQASEDGAGFDSGLIGRGGAPRPGLAVVLARMAAAPALLGAGAAPGGPEGGDTAPPEPVAPADQAVGPGRVRVARETVLAGPRRRIVLRLSCFGAPRCVADVRLAGLPRRPTRSSRGLTLARRSVAVASGRVRVHRFELTRRGRRWLRHVRSGARIAVLVRPARGAAAVEPQLVALPVRR
jgi:hypothetical protein